MISIYAIAQDVLEQPHATGQLSNRVRQCVALVGIDPKSSRTPGSNVAISGEMPLAMSIFLLKVSAFRP